MGHRPIVLLGGATTRIGDPSGKEETRQILGESQIEKNIQSIKYCFQRFLRFDDSPSGALLVNNRDWLDDLNYIDFLRDYGRHFSVNRMLGFDSVKIRLEREQNLSFLEFNYMVFQAYDFLELSRRHDCVLQMGGADQWGNIINGVELAHKTDQRQIFGLTAPLIVTENGQKMGKTASGAVWLDASKTSPWVYWQYWRNVDDKDVERFLKLFTDLPTKKIGELKATRENKINDVKMILANEATKLLHGTEALKNIYAKLEDTHLSNKPRRIVKNFPNKQNTQQPKTLKKPETYEHTLQVLQKQTDWLKEVQKRTQLLSEMERQINWMKDIQEQIERLDVFYKQADWLKEIQKRADWLKEFQKQADWLKKFQERTDWLKEFQGQTDQLKKFWTQINLPVAFDALQRQADLLSTAQKQKNLLDEIQGGIGLLDALRKVELATSNNEARRFVHDGAVRVNGKVIKDEKYVLTSKDSRESDGNIHLSVGKKRHHLLRLGAE